MLKTLDKIILGSLITGVSAYYISNPEFTNLDLTVASSLVIYSGIIKSRINEFMDIKNIVNSPDYKNLE